MSTPDAALWSAYGEGRQDESEVSVLQLLILRNTLKAIYAEVAGGQRPYSGDSYLPPHLVQQIADAIRISEQVTT